MPSVISLYMVYSFLRLLTKKWTDTDAYKQGIIDEHGKLLKKPEDFTTEAERNAYTPWIRLIFNVKRLMEKIPLGKSTLARYAAALWLIKENAPAGFDFDEIVKHFDIFPTNDIVQEGLEYSTHLQPGTYINIETGSYYSFLKEQKACAHFAGFPIFKLDEDYVTEADLLYVGENLIYEDMVTTSAVAGVKSGDEPPGPKVGSFGKHKWFESDDDDMFKKCKNGKAKYHRYDKYVGDSPVGRAIREYGLKNPKKPIILKDKLTGSMMYLRHPVN